MPFLYATEQLETQVVVKQAVADAVSRAVLGSVLAEDRLSPGPGVGATWTQLIRQGIFEEQGKAPGAPAAQPALGDGKLRCVEDKPQEEPEWDEEALPVADASGGADVPALEDRGNPLEEVVVELESEAGGEAASPAEDEAPAGAEECGTSDSDDSPSSDASSVPTVQSESESEKIQLEEVSWVLPLCKKAKLHREDDGWCTKCALDVEMATGGTGYD